MNQDTKFFKNSIILWGIVSSVLDMYIRYLKV